MVPLWHRFVNAATMPPGLANWRPPKKLLLVVAESFA